MALGGGMERRIQTDIIQTLKLREDVLICKRTFDRPNLAINVLRKKDAWDFDASLGAAMEPLVQSLIEEEREGSSGAADSSTIIYARTKAEVDEICSFLQQRLDEKNSSVQVESYYGGQDSCPAERFQTLVNFLEGETAVVVATVAFVIDKPDIRRVIHFGPPKTVEQYYQQFGQAGRDGLPAECSMFFSPHDFDKYQTNFYLGSSYDETRAANVQSIRAFKNFALNKETCRRKALLGIFGEKPSFGQHCGTCDVCQTRHHHGDARDCGPYARLVLLAVSKLRNQGMTAVLNVLGGKIVEYFRYTFGTDAEKLKVRLETERAALPTKKITQKQLKELVTALIQGNYISETTIHSVVNGFSRSWAIFSLTELGARALQDPDYPIVLSVPCFVRKAEKTKEIRKKRAL